MPTRALNDAVRYGLAAGGLLLAHALVAQATPASGPGVLPSPLPLQACFDLACRRNTNVRAAYLAAEADRARITQAKGSFDPGFFTEASGERLRDPETGAANGASESRAGAISAGISQRLVTGTEVELSAALDASDDLDLPSSSARSVSTGAALLVRQDLLRNAGLEVNRTGIRQAEDTWRAAVEGLRDSLIGALFGIEQDYWNLYFAEADLRVREEQLARANRLVAVAEAQVRVGQSAPIDITRARSSAASQMVSIASARSRIPVLRHRLLRALGVLDPSTANERLILADDPPSAAAAEFTLDASLDTAYAQRPDCRQARIGVTQAERQEDYYANQALPSLRLYGGVEVRGEDTNLEDSRQETTSGDYDNWVAGVRLDVPLGNRAALGARRAAELERRRAVVLQRGVLEQATREVADASADLQTAKEQLDTTRQSSQLARDLLQAEEKSFRLGRSTSLDVLDAQQALAAAEREEVRARVTYATAVSYLLVVRGDFLERKGVSLDRLPDLGDTTAEP